MAKNKITEQTLQDWPTIAKLHKEVSKIKVQAHSDYIVDEINDYGLDIDVVVESKAKELAVQGYLKKYENNLQEVL